jgi:hypothetical protein
MDMREPVRTDPETLAYYAKLCDVRAPDRVAGVYRGIPIIETPLFAPGVVWTRRARPR